MSEIAKLRARGCVIVMIGHRGHPEVEGTMGQADEGIYLVEDLAGVARLAVRDPRRLAFVTQTTLSIDDASRIVTALRERFPMIAAPKQADICYATQNRQDAIKILAPQVDVVIVVGSRTSSNSNRLREVAERAGVPAYLVDGPQDIEPAWVHQRGRIGLTAGASAPEVLVQAVTDRLRALGAGTVTTLQGKQESIVFPLPVGLGRHRAAPPEPAAQSTPGPADAPQPAKASA